MNILYQTYVKLSPTSGGTERTTLTVARELRRLYNARIYSVYEAQASTPTPDCIDDEYLWHVDRDEAKNVATLREVIVRWSIDAVIVQGAFIHVKRFRKAIGELNCKLVFAHHFAPGFEAEANTFYNHISQIPSGSLKNYLRWMRKAIFFWRYRHREAGILKSDYNSAYLNADTTVLLSDRLTDKFKAFGHIEGCEKFRYIPNALTFDEFASPNDFARKKRKVLIVSRLDDTPKNISLALEIWRLVKSDSRSRGWTLDIIGHGPDEAKYRRQVKRKRIPDVSFLGRKNPIEDYRAASIFMMTSRCESWGLTLTEAQQMGVVPVAFDTYATLTEILTDGEDSIVSEPGDVGQYVEAVLTLMTDTTLRHKLAINGLHNCQRFNPEKIAKMWQELLS